MNGDVPDPDTLEFLCGEAREVVDNQVDTLSDIDDKAMWTLRIIVLVFGLLLTALTIAVRAEVDTLARFVNPFTVFGTGALVLGLLTSVVAYSHTRFKPGPSSRDIKELLERDLDRGRYRESVLRSYQHWILHNRHSIERDSTLLFLCQMLLVVGIASLAAGIIANI